MCNIQKLVGTVANSLPETSKINVKWLFRFIICWYDYFENSKSRFTTIKSMPLWLNLSGYLNFQYIFRIQSMRETTNESTMFCCCFIAILFTGLPLTIAYEIMCNAYCVQISKVKENKNLTNSFGSFLYFIYILAFLFHRWKWNALTEWWTDGDGRMNWWY